MSGIDEISKALGALDAHAQEQSRQLRALFGKLEHLEKCQTETNGMVKLMGQQIAMHEIADKQFRSEIKTDVMPVIAALERLKQRGVGALIGVSLLSTGSGAVGGYALAPLLKRLLGGS